MPAAISQIIRVAVSAVLFYAALITLIVVPALNGYLPRVFEQQTGRSLQLRDLTLNPFTLRLTVTGVRNDNPDNSPFFAFERAIADISLRSLWQGLTFDELRLDGLALHITQSAPDRFNFSDILDHRARSAPGTVPSASATEIPAIHIDTLHIAATSLQMQAPHLSTPIALALQNLAFDGDTLTTVIEAARATDALPPLSARQLQLTLARADVTLPRDDAFHTHIEALRAGIELFSTHDVQGQPFTLALRDEAGGTVSATGQLSLAAAQATGEFDLQRISLLPAWRYLKSHLNSDLQRGTASARARFDTSWKNTPRIALQQGQASLDALALRARDDANTQLALQQWQVKGFAVDSATQQVHIAQSRIDGLHLTGWNRDTHVSLFELFKTTFRATDDDESTPAWHLRIDELSADNNRIDWRTDVLSEEQLSIAPLQVHARNIVWPEAAPAQIKLATRINDTTTLSLQGTLTPATTSGEISGEIGALPLSWANRQVEPQIAAYISSGTLTSQWQLTLDQGAPTRIAAAGTIDTFKFLRKSNDQQLAAWQQLQFRDLAVDVTAQRVTLNRIDLLKPEARFRIDADGTTNFQQLVIAAHKTHNETPSTAPISTPAAAPTTPRPTAARPWHVAVAQIHLQQGELDFRDNTLPRPFRALIGDLSGDITGLSTDPAALARVDLRGSVDSYAPVTLIGTIAPLRDEPALDLALDFTNLDLATLTTYSGTYAGYAINRGLLTLQLVYKLEDRRLQGQNRIVITRLELGEKVASPKAVDLPLRLALALLTDENGVIDLGVGVEGDLDNPEFSVRGIIWKALRNVIVKAVTSPFRLLAGLVGGGDEELGLVDFEAGNDELAAASRERLGKLVEALAKRPALRLRVIGHTDAATDAAAMKQGKLEYFLSTDDVSDADVAERNRSWRKAIERLYEKTFPDRAIGEQTPEQLEAALRDGMTLGDDAMSWLAARRALAVKRILVVELGLASDRVLIDASTDDRSGGNRKQVELRVDN